MKSESKFDKLDQEWRAGMMSADDDSVNKTIVQSAINLISLELAKKLDEDLISLREQLKTASEQYSQGKKENTLRIEFLIEVLRSRGVDVPDIDSYVKSAKQVLSEPDEDNPHPAIAAAKDSIAAFSKKHGVSVSITGDRNF